MLETQTTGAHAFIGTLKANGIDTIFGLPGSTEAPLLEALRADAEMRYVLTLQETVTVAMADGYARAGNRVGVVGLHTTVGTMNGLSQIYNAARDNSPIVVTAGNKDTGVLAADGFCALPDLPSLARSFVKHSWQSLTRERRRNRPAARDQRRDGEPAGTDVPLDTGRRSSRRRRSGRQRRTSAFAAAPDAHLERRPGAEAVDERGAPAARSPASDAGARCIDGGPCRNRTRARRSAGTAGVRDRADAALRTSVSGRRSRAISDSTANSGR